MRNPLLNILDRIHTLSDRLSRKPDARWAVVTDVAPLRIRYDTDTNPLDGTPSTLITGLTVGDRVMVLVVNNQVTVIGRGGG